MSPVLDLDKSKASGVSTSLRAKCNDMPGKKKRDAPPQPPFKCILLQA